MSFCGKIIKNLSGKRDSDPRPQPWQGCALPTELFPQQINIFLKVKRRRLELPRHNCHYPLKVARLPIPPPLQMFVFNLWCPEQDSNLHVVKHTHLKRARLPIPPPGLFGQSNAPRVLFRMCERKTGLGPATPTLARLCSTN